MGTQNPILWKASGVDLEASFIWSFKQHLEKKFNLLFRDYSELHHWSVRYYQSFWRELLLWSGIKFEGLADVVLVDKVGKFYGGCWFPQVKLNYAENILSHLSEVPLKSFYEKNKVICELTKVELLGAVQLFQKQLLAKGFKSGDRVAAFVGNNQLAIISMLAVTSLGGVWASCSPDFGEQGVLDRFQQVNPQFYLYDEYTVYGGKEFDLREKSNSIAAQLHTQNISLKEFWELYCAQKKPKALLPELRFEKLPFSAPLYILFSSGTTGTPKCIVHSAGGVLLQHVKELLLHSNLKKNERFFYYTTTGWMMWNWMLSGLYAGAELYTLEGAPMVGDWTLWDFVHENKIKAFGTSARFIAASRTKALSPQIEVPRITFSTGSPLLPEDFDYYYSVIESQIDSPKKSQLASVSGGTDIVSCFMLGNPWIPVRRGEIQAAGLGMDIDAFDAERFSVRDEEGELVCKTPFPAMPLSFLKDPENKKFEEAYFKRFRGVWHHGDFVTITSEGGIIMHGRSDTTLNPGGVRIGTAEIYRVVEQDPQVADSLVVGKILDGDEKVVLFIKLKEGELKGELTDELKLRLKKTLREKASPRHVPDFIFAVEEIPYTLSGKKVELAVKKLLKGEAPTNTEALQNPGSLKLFERFKSLVEHKP